MRRSLKVWPFVGVFITVVALSSPLSALWAADSISLFVNGDDFLPGQRLSFGLGSLTRTTAVDVYLGIALPDGSLLFFDSSGTAILNGSSGLNQMPRLASFPANPPANQSTHVEIDFPTVGLSSGTYQLELFIASVVAGAFQDNALGPSELLAVDARAITFLYSPDPRFEVEASVSASQRALVQDAVLQTRDFLKVLGAPDLGAVTLFVAETLTGLGQAYATWLHISPDQAIQQKSGVTGEGALGFVFLRAPVSDRTRVYHELFHVLQNRLVGSVIFTGDFVPFAGPTWLIEGSAVYFQGLAAGHYALFDFSGFRNDRLQRARGTSATLVTLETRSGIQAVGSDTGYSLGFAAVDFLLGSKRITHLLEFWQRIGEGLSWPQAFAQVFGRSTEVFYQQFEAYRQAAFPPNGN